MARRWKLIASVAAVALLAAALSTALLVRLAPLYQAEATIRVSTPAYRLVLDPKLPNVEVDSRPVTSTAPEESRPGALLDESRIIVHSDEVRDIVGQRSGGGPQSRGSQTNGIDVRQRGSLIAISASADQPQEAARIAQLYAEATVARLNTLYGWADEATSELQSKLNETVANHERAQAELSAFTREERVDQLQTVIKQREALREALSSQHNAAVAARLANYYNGLLETERLERAAQVLRQQVEAAGQSPASATALGVTLVTLQLRLASLAPMSPTYVVAGSLPAPTEPRMDTGTATRPTDTDRPPPNQPPTNLAPSNASQQTAPPIQLQLSGESIAAVSADQQKLLSDVDALLASLVAQRSDLQHAIEGLLMQLAHPGGTGAASGSIEADSAVQQTLMQLAAEANELRSELGNQLLRKSALEQNVELARAARVTIETKAQEARLGSNTGARKAAIASSASIPTGHSFPPPLSLILAAGGFFGVLVGLAAAFAAEFFALRRREAAGPPLVSTPVSAAH